MGKYVALKNMGLQGDTPNVPYSNCVGFYLLLGVIHGRQEMQSDSDKVFLDCC